MTEPLLSSSFAAPNLHERLHYLFIAEHSLLVWAKHPSGEVDDIIARTNGGDSCIIVSHHVAVKDEQYICAIISHPSFTYGAPCMVSLMDGDELCAMHEGSLSSDDTSERLLYLFGQMDGNEQHAFFGFLTGEAMELFPLAQSLRFKTLCIHLLNSLDSAHFDVKESFWLTPTVLYLEGISQQVRPYGEPRIFMLSEEHCSSSISRFIQLSEHGFAFIVVFDSEYPADTITHNSLTYFSDNQLVRFDHTSPRPAYGLEFTQYLCSRPAYQRDGLRSLICQALLDFTPPERKLYTKELIHKLQLYVTTETSLCTNPADPFNMHFERVIPLGNDGVFVNGWMRDP
jgi:hypothetical protein